MKKLCILGSHFYGYEKEMVNEFKKKYKVKFINYRLNTFEFLFSKIFGIKIKNFIINRKLKQNLEDKEIDVLLIIGGQELDSNNFIYLKKNYNIKKYILYLWDNIERVKNFENISSFCDNIYSFDKKDCKKYNLKYRPTFYSKRLEKLKNSDFKESIDIFFVGIYRKNRLDIVKELYGEKNYIYLYYPKIFFYLLKFLKREEFKKINSKYINFQPIKKEDYNELFKKSKYILDIPENNQSGLTQRILDSLFLNKKIITTQKSLLEEKFYNENNILLIESYEDIYKNKIFFEKEYEIISNEIVHYYSIEKWAEDILK